MRRSCANCFNAIGGGDTEKIMSIRTFASRSIAALAGVSMLALSLSPASALTLAGPSLEKSVASAQIDKVWWRGGWGWRGGGWGWRGGWGYRGWGWGPAAVVGGLAAGAIVGGAIASRPYYGYGYGYGPCWRQVVGPNGGPAWQRVC
jgi:hypothetical protein